MAALILLAIAIVLISAVTHDLFRTSRSDTIGTRILAEEKERQRAARRLR